MHTHLFVYKHIMYYIIFQIISLFKGKQPSDMQNQAKERSISNNNKILKHFQKYNNNNNQIWFL